MLKNIGDVLTVLAENKEERDEALRYMSRGLAIREEKLGPDSVEVAFSKNGIAKWYGIVYQRSTDDEEKRNAIETALQYAVESNTILREVLPKNHPRIGNSYYFVGRNHYNLGEYKAAIRHLEDALAIFEEVYPEVHKDPQKVRRYLAASLIDSEQLEAAERIILVAIELGPAHPQNHHIHARILRATGRMDEALEADARAAALES